MGLSAGGVPGRFGPNISVAVSSLSPMGVLLPWLVLWACTHRCQLLASICPEGGMWRDSGTGQARCVPYTQGPEGPCRQGLTFLVLRGGGLSEQQPPPGAPGIPGCLSTSPAPPSEAAGRRAVTAQLPGCLLLAFLRELSEGWVGCPRCECGGGGIFGQGGDF